MVNENEHIRKGQLFYRENQAILKTGTGETVICSDGFPLTAGKKKEITEQLAEHGFTPKQCTELITWLEIGITEELLETLADPDFFINVLNESSKFVVDEEESRHAILLCSAGMLVKNARIASYNLLVNDDSGVGKDWVVTHTLGIWPEERYTKRTKITPEVFTYWHENDLDWTWGGQLLYLEDVSNRLFNCETFKKMASSGSVATVIRNQEAVDIPIRGKPVMIVTGAGIQFSEEMLRRFPLLNLNSTQEQTKEIVKRAFKDEESGTLINTEYNEQLKEVLTKLRNVNVKVPFVRKLVDYIPTSHPIIRTQIGRIIDYIRASAAIHQYARPIDSEGNILANGQDYEFARKALMKVMPNSLLMPLTREEQQMLGVIQSLGTNEYHSRDTIHASLPEMSESGIRRRLDSLLKKGFLETDWIRTNSDQRAWGYQYKEIPAFSLPAWEELTRQNTATETIDALDNHSESRQENEPITIMAGGQ